MSCEICPIITSPSPEEQSARLIEGRNWLATLRGNDQTLPGTSFITARRHIGTLTELTRDEQVEFFDIHNRLETAIKRAFGAAVINTSCLMNLAFRDEPAEPHVHWHVKPRYHHPVTIGEYTYADPAFGSYLDGHYERTVPTKEQFERIITEIQKHL